MRVSRRASRPSPWSRATPQNAGCHCARPAAAAPSPRAHARRRTRPASARCQRGRRPAGVWRIDEELQVPGLRVLGHFVGVVHRRVRHVERLQATAPLGAVAAAKQRAQQFDQRFLVRRCAPRGWRSARRRTASGRSIAVARPCQNFSGDDMCSAIHLPSAQSQHVRLRHAGPAVRAHHLAGRRTGAVKASRLKCVMASNIETSTVRPTAAVVSRSNSAPRTP